MIEKSGVFFKPDFFMSKYWLNLQRDTFSFAMYKYLIIAFFLSSCDPSIDDIARQDLLLVYENAKDFYKKEDYTLAYKNAYAYWEKVQQKGYRYETGIALL